MIHAAFRRGAAALTACALLSGCAGDGGPAAAERRRFDGLYHGRQIPTGTGYACGDRAREVWFGVGKGVIELRFSRHRRNHRKLGLWGTVAADGAVAMQQGAGGRNVVGRIEGDHLVAAELQDRRDAQDGRVGCAYRYEATRAGSGAAGASEIAVAPPAERQPRP